MQRLVRLLALLLAIEATGVLLPITTAIAEAAEGCTDEDDAPCDDCAADECGICVFCPLRAVAPEFRFAPPVRASMVRVLAPVADPVISAEPHDVFHPPRR